MTAEEADALALSGMPEAAAELGLGRVLAAAQLKVQAALPTELSDRAGRIAERFHLDAPGWFREADHVPTLTGVADAVWNQRVLRVRYRRWATGGREPRGGARARTARRSCSRPAPGTSSPAARRRPTRRRAPTASPASSTLETLDARFDRPEGFDLWKFWHQRTEELTDALYQAEATVRFSPRALELAPVAPAPAHRPRPGRGRLARRRRRLDRGRHPDRVPRPRPLRAPRPSAPRSRSSPRRPCASRCSDAARALAALYA